MVSLATGDHQIITFHSDKLLGLAYGLSGKAFEGIPNFMCMFFFHINPFYQRRQVLPRFTSEVLNKTPSLSWQPSRTGSTRR